MKLEGECVKFNILSITLNLSMIELEQLKFGGASLKHESSTERQSKQATLTGEFSASSYAPENTRV